jgi:hypothetical protein
MPCFRHFYEENVEGTEIPFDPVSLYRVDNSNTSSMINKKLDIGLERIRQLEVSVYRGESCRFNPHIFFALSGSYISHSLRTIVLSDEYIVTAFLFLIENTCFPSLENVVIGFTLPPHECNFESYNLLSLRKLPKLIRLELNGPITLFSYRQKINFPQYLFRNAFTSLKYLVISQYDDNFQIDHISHLKNLEYLGLYVESVIPEKLSLFPKLKEVLLYKGVSNSDDDMLKLCKRIEGVNIDLKVVTENVPCVYNFEQLIRMRMIHHIPISNESLDHYEDLIEISEKNDQD